MRVVRGVYVHERAFVCGDVKIGAGSSLWPGTVVRGDCAPITIGERTNIQDLSVVHCDDDVPNVIGSDVTLGHGVIAHGVEIGDGSLVGIGARLLAGCKIGRGCLVAAGAVVPPNLVVPDGTVVMGLPARVVRETSAKEKAYLVEVPRRYLALAKLHHERPEDPRVRSWQ
jgi:carbonic anhydrase/acetyltransferase-like protein (isoleucine patch superfamily)